jgi:hypothetical protein
LHQYPAAHLLSIAAEILSAFMKDENIEGLG